MNYIISSLIIVILLGCGSTSLVYNPDKIHIENSYLKYNLKGTTLYTDKVNLNTIRIERQVFQSSDNETLVYEYATLNTKYSFKYDYSYTLSHVFNAKKVRSIKNKEGLGFYRIHLKDNSYVYALLKTGTKRSLTMVYGFCEKNFNALLNNTPLSKQESRLQNAQEHIKSQWNMNMIIMATLLEKKGGRRFLQ